MNFYIIALLRLLSLSTGCYFFWKELVLLGVLCFVIYAYLLFLTPKFPAPKEYQDWDGYDDPIN